MHVSKEYKEQGGSPGILTGLSKLTTQVFEKDSKSRSGHDFFDNARETSSSSDIKLLKLDGNCKYEDVDGICS